MKCQTILNVLKMHSRYVVIRPPLDPITTAAAHLQYMQQKTDCGTKIR